ncbi:hypothetical protein ACU6TU_08370 [Halomonas sp. LS-001]
MTDPIQGEYLAGSVSAKYQNRTTAVARRIADLVRERGIKEGMLSVKVARQVDPHLNSGDTLTIAGATFMVGLR